MDRVKITCMCVVLLIAATTGCIGGATSNPHASVSPNASSSTVPLQISVDEQEYAPWMSSTVGIGLTPAYPASVDNRTVDFRWQTDYGYFVIWDKSSDFKVLDQGQNFTANDSKIYWSYSPDDMGKVKPEVHVRLAMIDRSTGQTKGEAALTIGWMGTTGSIPGKGNDTAVPQARLAGR